MISFKIIKHIAHAQRQSAVQVLALALRDLLAGCLKLVTPLQTNYDASRNYMTPGAAELGY